jgi:alpha-tubulin suppressor-like RCC1 family protein
MLSSSLSISELLGAERTLPIKTSTTQNHSISQSPLKKTPFTQPPLTQPSIRQGQLTKSSILQTQFVPYLQSENCTTQLQSTNEVLETTESQLAAANSEIQSLIDSCVSCMDTECESLLEETRSNLSDVESILEITRAEFSDTDQLLQTTESRLDDTLNELESVNEDLSGANSEIDEAELLLSGTSIPDASVIDATIATMFSLLPCTTNCAGYNPNEPLVDQIDSGLIPYLQSALANLGEFSSIVKIAAGDFHTVVLTANGKVYATGYNSNGQLGTGDTTQTTMLTAMIGEGASGVTDIAAGGRFTVILKGDKVYGTGLNTLGQLGTGNTTTAYQLTEMTGEGMLGVTAIAAGGQHTIVLKDGVAYTTGQNAYGQLGIGVNSKEVSNPDYKRTTLTQMIGIGASGVSAIAGGDLHTVVLKDNRAYTTGLNQQGQLGIGTNGNNDLSPEYLRNTLTLMIGEGSSGVTAIASGGKHTVILKSDVAYTTGINEYGELGIGVNGVYGSPDYLRNTLTLMISEGSSGVTAIVGGGRHTVIVKSGVAYATGQNNYGQLGIGVSSEDPGNPDYLRNLLTAMIDEGESNISTITAGGLHTVSLKNDHTVYTTGNNDFGQLGINNAIDKSTLTNIYGKNICYIFQ